MDVTRNFFNKLRTLAVTLEKQAEQFKHIFQSDGTEFEDDSPMRYLHELYSEVRMLKSDADNTLCKSSSERDATYDFIKASKILMKRNSTDLEKIRDLFQKYGYKQIAGKDAATQAEAEINPASTMSTEEEPQNLDLPEKSSAYHSPHHIPQLSDFGLSKYALPTTSGTIHIQPTFLQKEDQRVSDSKCLSPKAEHFHIHGRDLCLIDETTILMEDQTIFLLNAKNARQANKSSGSAVELVSNKNLATPKQKNKFCDYDYMASPAAPQFCTPGLKIPCRKDTILAKSPESNKLDASNHMTEASLPDAQPLKTEPKQMCVTKVVPNNKGLVEDAVAPVLYSDKYPKCVEPSSVVLDCLEEPSPPAISDYSNLFGSPPPPPEITVIPKQIFQILSKYNPNIEASRSLEKGSYEGIATQPVLGIGNNKNKENRKYLD
ncbi:spindle and kinetochore-associated protein 3 isoform X2 [Rhineura floridana]|uniref:spindle and kinetochore-associated protein 3 isoform X2 n=1 Tax=Rhineura floridana TaxID=261503 RepID=UPI002AC80676|nr:spindle and kinetochore-associated protein 3 isoform X2 [Rhineura floridana]